MSFKTQRLQAENYDVAQAVTLEHALVQLIAIVISIASTELSIETNEAAC